MNRPDRKPHYIELVSDTKRTRTYGVPLEELGEFISNRFAMVKAGDPTPVDIPHSDGRIIRSQCAVLPGGGRMLTYTDITDLVRRAAQFEELAAIDGLTGVCNRRRFNTLAQAEWSRFQRYHRPLSVLEVDVDYFKQINDRYGHDAGDRALAHVAMLCRRDRRETDIVSRIGGDEFILLLPETDLAQARTVAERLRDTISKSKLPRSEGSEQLITLKVSIGIAEAKLSMSGIEALLKWADHALYRAKAAGRNRVATAGPPAVDTRAAAE